KAQEEAGKAQKAERETRLQLLRANNSLLTTQLLRVAATYERDPGQGLALLHDCNACPLDVRDAAWRYYERACRRWQRDTPLGPRGEVNAVAFSPDGKALASGSWGANQGGDSSRERCACGTRPRAGSRRSSGATPVWSGPWRSAPTARPSPPAGAGSCCR